MVVGAVTVAAMGAVFGALLVLALFRLFRVPSRDAAASLVPTSLQNNPISIAVPSATPISTPLAFVAETNLPTAHGTCFLTPHPSPRLYGALLSK